MLHHRARQHDHVGEREVHALGAGWRLDMSGIARQEQPAVLHGLDHEAAHRGDTLLQHLALDKLARAADPRVQLPPDALVRPGFNLIVGRALQIEAREHQGAHGVERKAALVIGIDQLFGGGGRLGENADPPERIFAIVEQHPPRRDAGAADAMEAIAAADEIALDLLVAAAMTEANFRLCAGDVVEAHVVNFEQNLAAVGKPLCDQVLDDLLLAINGDALAHQLPKTDLVQRAVETEMNAVVGEPLALHALAHASIDQEITRPLLDQTGADAALDIVAAAVLDDDRVDALEIHEVGEHEAGGPGADDSDLCTHMRFLA